MKRAKLEGDRKTIAQALRLLSAANIRFPGAVFDLAEIEGNGKAAKEQELTARTANAIRVIVAQDVKSKSNLHTQLTSLLASLPTTMTTPVPNAPKRTMSL